MSRKLIGAILALGLTATAGTAQNDPTKEIQGIIQWGAGGSAVIVALRTSRLPMVTGETLGKDILPRMVIVFIGFLIGFGLLLDPLGFVLTSALFLSVAIRVLSGWGWGRTLLAALVSLLVIWLVFRIVFTVLLPAGVLPESEFIQFFRNLFAGGAF